MNRLTFRSLTRLASASRVWVVSAIVAFALQGTPALSQVKAGDAPSRAAPGSIPNAPPMAGPAARSAPDTDVGPKGGGRRRGEATRRQCENLLTRAAAVQALQQGEDYEFCRARFPDIQSPGGATAVVPAAPPKN
jgi:hypothetical protein